MGHLVTAPTNMKTFSYLIVTAFVVFGIFSTASAGDPNGEWNEEAMERGDPNGEWNEEAMERGDRAALPLDDSVERAAAGDGAERMCRGGWKYSRGGNRVRCG